VLALPAVVHRNQLESKAGEVIPNGPVTVLLAVCLLIVAVALGRPRRKPRELFADRGYDFDKYRRLLRERGIIPRIARRNTEHGSGLGKTRRVVERAIAWLHACKRLRTRYERRADIHLGLLQLACALIRHQQLTRSLRHKA
jgi:transposase